MADHLTGDERAWLLAASLGTNPAAYFAWAHGALPDAEALREALGARAAE